MRPSRELKLAGAITYAFIIGAKWIRFAIPRESPSGAVRTGGTRLNMRDKLGRYKL